MTDTKPCRRCSECADRSHHWLPMPGLGWSMPGSEWDHGCKHCPARGMTCDDCGGEGCPSCDGEGVQLVSQDWLPGQWWDAMLEDLEENGQHPMAEALRQAWEKRQRVLLPCPKPAKIGDVFQRILMLTSHAVLLYDNGDGVARGMSGPETDGRSQAHIMRLAMEQAQDPQSQDIISQALAKSVQLRRDRIPCWLCLGRLGPQAEDKLAGIIRRVGVRGPDDPEDLPLAKPRGAFVFIWSAKGQPRPPQGARMADLERSAADHARRFPGLAICADHYWAGADLAWDELAKEIQKSWKQWRDHQDD